MKEAYQLEQALRAFLKQAREEIANRTEENQIIFSIIASGRVNDGDLEITFKLEQQYDSDYIARGGNLANCVSEFIRRAGWQKENKPLCLPKVPPQQDKDIISEEPAHNTMPRAPVFLDDEIPF